MPSPCWTLHHPPGRMLNGSLSLSFSPHLVHKEPSFLRSPQVQWESSYFPNALLYPPFSAHMSAVHQVSQSLPILGTNSKWLHREVLSLGWREGRNSGLCSLFCLSQHSMLPPWRPTQESCSLQEISSQIPLNPFMFLKWIRRDSKAMGLFSCYLLWSFC